MYIIDAINLDAYHSMNIEINILLTENGIIKASSLFSIPKMVILKVEILEKNESFRIVGYTTSHMIKIKNDSQNKASKLLALTRKFLIKNISSYIYEKIFFTKVVSLLKILNNTNAHLICAKIIFWTMQINGFMMQQYICYHCNNVINIKTGIYLSTDGIFCYDHKNNGIYFDENETKTLFSLYNTNTDNISYLQFESINSKIIEFIINSDMSKSDVH